MSAADITETPTKFTSMSRRHLGTAEYCVRWSEHQIAPHGGQIMSCDQCTQESSEGMKFILEREKLRGNGQKSGYFTPLVGSPAVRCPMNGPHPQDYPRLNRLGDGIVQAPTPPGARGIPRTTTSTSGPATTRLQRHASIRIIEQPDQGTHASKQQGDEHCLNFVPRSLLIARRSKPVKASPLCLDIENKEEIKRKTQTNSISFVSGAAAPTSLPPKFSIDSLYHRKHNTNPRSKAGILDKR